MKTINQQQLAEILFGVTHAMPIGFTALIDARARKTGNPFVEVVKLSRVSAFTGFDFESAVQRRQVKEGQEATFQASERQWGQRIAPALVENKGKLYLVAKIERTAKPVYLARKTADSLLLTVAKSLVAPFLPVSAPAVNQGVDREVIYRNYALESIAAISLNGSRYRVRHT